MRKFACVLLVHIATCAVISGCGAQSGSSAHSPVNQANPGTSPSEKVGESASSPRNLDEDNGFSKSPTEGTKIYRYLSAISDVKPDKDSLTSLCIKVHGFKLELPSEKIGSTHDVRLPVYEESSFEETVQVPVQKKRVDIYQPPSVNGIVMEPEKKEVSYTENESQVVTRQVVTSGTCVGTEYLLE